MVKEYKNVGEMTIFNTGVHGQTNKREQKTCNKDTNATEETNVDSPN
jgi:hypothetical protein